MSAKGSAEKTEMREPLGSLMDSARETEAMQ
jgi:hypothetical protein